jgi:hypothetical protein
MTLNFFSATKAHQDWKKRLLQCVCDNCNDNLDPERIAKDNLCALGMWLYERKAQNPILSKDANALFTRLLEEHAQFHLAAAQVARMALEGQRQEALTQLQGGDYARISNRVIATLGELYLKRREFGMD